MEIKKFLRPHLLNLIPYSSARDEFKGKAKVYLDANENSFGSTSRDKFRRYPDPYQLELKKKIGELKSIDPGNIFLGNGSDEPIDLLIRAFCNPGKDQIIINPPTYGMYEVSANINDVGIVKVQLRPDYTLDIQNVIDAIEPGIKIIFLCSPNNPTGNSIDTEDIFTILKKFQGLVVLDEAYIDFSTKSSLIDELKNYKNLIILQTFSKAWGLASLRLGMTFANAEFVEILNMIKPPYNVSGATQDLVLKALENEGKMKSMIADILEQKNQLESTLSRISSVLKIYPSDANFLLVKMENARDTYMKLSEKKIIVRDRSKVELCQGCLRITVGTENENQILVEQLESLK